jgi:glycosyltransferase involved in cell wall biosynthesis
MHWGWPRERFLEELAVRGIVPTKVSPDTDSFFLNGVHVEAVTEPSRASALRSIALCGRLDRAIATFKPDCVLVGSEDRAQRILSSATMHIGTPIVYIARSSSMLGIGPMAFFPNPAAQSLLEKAAAIVANSSYLAEYIWQHSQLKPIVLDVATYEVTSRPRDPGTEVLMINPCHLKGIDIMLGLASRFPRTTFTTVPGWGTTSLDRAALAECANIVIAERDDRIANILQRARLLLVPSLWDEAFGRVVVEAMAVGTPVLASEIGGLPESILGVPGLVPVNGINGYENRLDERGVPIAQRRPQSLAPWCDAMSDLLKDDVHSARSSLAYDTAKSYVRGLDVAAWEEVLERVIA